MPSAINQLYSFGEFRLDAQQRILRRGESLVPLTPKAFEILLILVQSGGELVTKDELMTAVWSESFVEESNLTQTVFMLRKALGETAERRYILTMPGRGYRFAANVTHAAGNGQVGVSEPSPLTVRDSEVLPSLDKPARWRWSVLAGVTVVLLASAGVYFHWLRPRNRPQAPTTRLMLAVFPFDNLTGDAAQDYFSDGLTEEMISQLGNLDPNRLGVIARTSVMHYKNNRVPLDEVGRALGVQYVLEGSVRRDAHNLRIAAQLIQVRDQTHLWARQYDREPKDLLMLQGEIGRELTDEIQLTLGNHVLPAPSRDSLSPENLEAYDLYLKGLFFWNKRTVEGFRQAISYFQQATDKDPHYARAYAGLADAYTLMSAYSLAPPNEFMPKARAAALRALELDDSLPEPHAALALIVQNYDWDWKTAEKEFRRAIELNPNYATGHHWYAEHLALMGRFEEALRESERARQLDPLSLIIATDNGAILYFSRQYDRAIAQFRGVLEMDPDFPRAQGLLVFAYVQNGQFAEALSIMETLHPLTTRNVILVYVYGRSGQETQARHALEELEHWNRNHPLDSAATLYGCLGMGDKDGAFDLLEKAYVQHSPILTVLKVDPIYDPLRSDARFQKLLRRVGLAQ